MKKLLIVVILFLGVSLNVGAPNFFTNRFEKVVEKYNEDIREVLVQNRLKEIKTLEFTPRLLREYLELKKVKYLKVIIAQFRLETGHFKSQSFRVYNNISGMKKPRIRPNLASGEALGHASYDHWTDSVDDYFLWQDYNSDKLANSSDYYKFLDKVGYAEDSQYIKIIKNIRVV